MRIESVHMDDERSKLKLGDFLVNNANAAHTAA